MGRRQMQFSRFLLVFCLAVTLAIPNIALAQSMGQPPPMAEKEKKKPKKDPLLSGAFAPIPMDEETKASLERSKVPGVLLAAEFTKDYVSRIRIVGAKKVEADAMIVQLKTHINRPYDHGLVREDIRRLFAVGIFAQVSVDKAVGPSGSIELTYNLKEKPTLFKVKFEGNDEVSEGDLSTAVEVERFHVADYVRIKENAEKIRKLYAEKGYFLVTVKYRLEPVKDEELNEKETSLHPDEENKIHINTPRIVGPDFVNLVYTIDEGSKIRIESITFSGNEKFSNEQLKDVILSKENHPFGAITKWGTYVEEISSEADPFFLEKFYQDNGYMNVVIGKPKVSMSADKTRFSIHIPISEGEQFFFGEIEVQGDFVVDEVDVSKLGRDDPPQFRRASLLRHISLKTGDVFNRSQVAKELLSIGESYQDFGYAYANIGPQTKVNESNRTVDLSLNIDAGPRVEIERIDITGNFRTANEVARRELRLFEGERYSSSLMRLSEMRLNQVGYFEKAKITTKEGSSRDKMIVEVELEERKTGTFSVGGGYGTNGEGLLFQSQIQQNNLFGRGQSLIASVQWSGYRRIFDLRFVDPYLTYVGDQPLTFLLAAFNADRFLGEFKRKSTGGEVTLGYPIGHPLSVYSRNWMRGASMASLPFIPDFDNLRFYVAYGIERVEISDVATGIELYGLHALQPRYTTALKPTLQLDQRNDRMFPTAGYLLEARAEFASFALGSAGLVAIENSFTSGSQNAGIYGGNWFLKPDPASNNFFRFGANARFYYNWDQWFPLSGWVLRMNFDLGIINTFNEQLISENYRMGGIGMGSMTGLRGYAFQSIGPVISVGHDRESHGLRQFVLGGNKQLLMNLELEFPIIKSMRLTGVLFFDMGNVYGPNENFFYAGGTRQPYYTSNFSDPLGTFYGMGLFSSIGFGIRWFSPMAPIRIEFGFPIVKRPPATPGIFNGDIPMSFDFNIGQSF
jgi:outer membrane protein insertion porin family